MLLNIKMLSIIYSDCHVFMLNVAKLEGAVNVAVQAGGLLT